MTELQGIHELLQFCPRLTHLSLTGVQAFLREDLTRFCREAPPEFTHPQRDVFCVFSGEGVSRLREYLKRLAEDQEREGRVSRDDREAYSEAEADSSRDTISDDGTVDATEEVSERRSRARPRSAGYRSYAEVVSGSGSNSPEREDDGEGNDEGAPLRQVRTGRISALFRRRSSRPGSFTEDDSVPRYRGYLSGHGRREASRSVSEGQGSSSRPRFTHSEGPAFDGYSPAIAESQPRRPLPPRPHWPPQAHTAQFFSDDQQLSAPYWGDFSTVQASSNVTRATATGPGLVLRRNGIRDREESTASAVYDTDDDAEMTVRQPSRLHRELDGEMES